MPRVGSELTIPTSERAKTANALDRATIVIDISAITSKYTIVWFDP
jgi:hypothetical protein